MFVKIKSMVGADKPNTVEDDLDPLIYAAAVLLYEVAAVDGHIGEDEEKLIAKILHDEFELTTEEGRRLLEAAKARAESSVQILPAVKTINQHYDDSNKAYLFELLWRVVLADGNREDYESALMRRLAGLLYVSDKASGTARQRASRQLEQS